MDQQSQTNNPSFFKHVSRKTSKEQQQQQETNIFVKDQKPTHLLRKSFFTKTTEIQNQDKVQVGQDEWDAWP